MDIDGGHTSTHVALDVTCVGPSGSTAIRASALVPTFLSLVMSPGFQRPWLTAIDMLHGCRALWSVG